MIAKPVVFVSSTSDLRSARDLVGKVLYSMGYEPIWQDIEATDGGELLDILRKRIEPCQVMIQLIGDRYGAEPPYASPEFGRVSFTQFEALYAEKLGRKVVYHFLTGDFPVDTASPESDEFRNRQTAYRDRIIRANRLHQPNIKSRQDLELSVRRISDDLAAIRRETDRRFRRVLWLVSGALVGVFLVTTLVVLILYRQRETQRQITVGNLQMQDEVAALRAEVVTAIAPSPPISGEKQSASLPPELLAKARILLERGNEEDRAIAKIALNRHDDADRIIQQLKSKPGNPIDEAFRLLTMEGDNWYRTDTPDKAIAPFESAVALKPGDVRAREHLALAHAFAKLGSLADHQHRAIEISSGTLEIAAPGSIDWALAQEDICLAQMRLPNGNRSENLRNSAAAAGAALTVFSLERNPEEWARVKNQIGLVCLYQTDGDKTQNLQRAIDAFEATLVVFTKVSRPRAWAIAQHNLGIAWSEMPAGDRRENLQKALAAYEMALTVDTKEAYPTAWAGTMGSVGEVWESMPTGDRVENLHKAISAYEQAQSIFKLGTDPDNFAMTMDLRSKAWSEMPAADHGQNLLNAIACAKAALLVYTPVDYPQNHKEISNRLTNLGALYVSTPFSATQPFDSISPAQ